MRMSVYVYLVGAVKQREHVTLLHGHLARRLLRVIIQRHHTLLTQVIDHRLLLLLKYSPDLSQNDTHTDQQEITNQRLKLYDQMMTCTCLIGFDSNQVHSVLNEFQSYNNYVMFLDDCVGCSS